MGTVHLLEDVLIAIVVYIGEDDAMSLLDMCETISIADIHETGSAAVPVHDPQIVRVSSAKVKIEITIVGEIAEIRPHQGVRTHQVVLLRDLHSSVVKVAKLTSIISLGE